MGKAHLSQALQERRFRRLLTGLFLLFLIGVSLFWFDSYRTSSEFAIGLGMKNHAKIVFVADSGRLNLAYGTSGAFKTGFFYQRLPSENGARYEIMQESRSHTAWYAVEFSCLWLIVAIAVVYVGAIGWLNERGRRI